VGSQCSITISAAFVYDMFGHKALFGRNRSDRLISSECGIRMITMIDNSPYDAALCFRAFDDEVEDITRKDSEDDNVGS
jgi:hypothetical protein